MKQGGPAIHPGKILSDELTEIGVTASDLARAIGVPIDSRPPDSEGPAGHHCRHGAQARSVVQLEPEIWMDLQKDYELRTAEAALGKAAQGHTSSAGTPGRSAIPAFSDGALAPRRISRTTAGPKGDGFIHTAAAGPQSCRAD